MEDSFLEKQAKIKVFGVGGCGCNSISRMYKNDVQGVEFIAVNTDVQALKHTHAHVWIPIGKKETGGLGAGTDPNIGRLSALEQKKEIRENILGADLVIVTAGMGGGTGTGAAPVVAQIAKDEGILVIGVVTLPFNSEGKQKMEIAQDGVMRLRENCDSLILVSNERIFSIIDANTLEVDAYREIDKYLRTTVQGIAEAVMYPGEHNVDMNDIKKTFKNKGTSFVGIGVASGLDRSVKALRLALKSEMVPASISSATDLIVITTVDPANATMLEDSRLKNEIKALVNVEKVITKFGTYYRPNQGADYIVTIIATGFDANIGSNDMEKLVRSLLEDYHLKKNFGFENTQSEETDEEYDIPDWLKKKK